MASQILHPFAVDVRANRRQAPGLPAYTWSIRQKGLVKSRSVTAYHTFEEARLALKAELGEMVAAWEAGQHPARDRLKPNEKARRGVNRAG